MHTSRRNNLLNCNIFLFLQDALYLFAQVVLGVHHIHSKNILHRDLKPENIMLTGHMGDIVKIGDFGLSKCLHEWDKQTLFLLLSIAGVNFNDCLFIRSNLSHAGSYYYIAPEMLKKEPYDFKSDIWSMGVVFYEMLTKEFAFPATVMNTHFLERKKKITQKLYFLFLEYVRNRRYDMQRYAAFVQVGQCFTWIANNCLQNSAATAVKKANVKVTFTQSKSRAVRSKGLLEFGTFLRRVYWKFWNSNFWTIYPEIFRENRTEVSFSSVVFLYFYKFVVRTSENKIPNVEVHFSKVD